MATARSTIWTVAGGVLGLGAAAALWVLAHQPGPPGPDARAAAEEPAAPFVRLQSEMNRVADGHGIRPVEAVPDKLDLLADALQALLAGNAARAGKLLDTVEAEIDRRLPTEDEIAADAAKAGRAEWLTSYFELLPGPPQTGSLKRETAAFVRFATVMRKVDALMLAGMLPSLDGYDLVARRSTGGPLDEVWLRFPCRVAAHHRPALEAAAKRLKQLAGPLTDCPLPRDKAGDLGLAEKVAKDPMAALVLPPPPVGEPAGVLMKAAATGSMADIAQALKAGGDPHRADGHGRTAVHYVLTNPRLSPPERAEAVRLLF
ncbi:MAG: ankyrin repeat domain-containing protein [Actinomycetota bacterium]